MRPLHINPSPAPRSVEHRTEQNTEPNTHSTACKLLLSTQTPTESLVSRPTRHLTSTRALSHRSEQARTRAREQGPPWDLKTQRRQGQGQRQGRGRRREKRKEEKRKAKQGRGAGRERVQTKVHPRPGARTTRGGSRFTPGSPREVLSPTCHPSQPHAVSSPARGLRRGVWLGGSLRRRGGH